MKDEIKTCCVSNKKMFNVLLAFGVFVVISGAIVLLLLLRRSRCWPQRCSSVGTKKSAPKKSCAQPKCAPKPAVAVQILPFALPKAIPLIVSSPAGDPEEELG